MSHSSGGGSYHSGRRPADFRVKPDGIRIAGTELRYVSSKIERVNGELNDVKSALAPYRIISRARLSLVSAELYRDSQNIKNIGQKLHDVADLYDRYDERVAGKCGNWSIFDQISPYFMPGLDSVTHSILNFGDSSNDGGSGSAGNGSGGGGGGSWGDENGPRWFTSQSKHEAKYGDSELDFKDYYDENKERNGFFSSRASDLGKRIDDFNKDNKTTLFEYKSIDLEKVTDQAGKDELEQLQKNQIFDGVDVKLFSAGDGTERSVYRDDEIIGDKDGSHFSAQFRALNFDTNYGAYVGLLGLGATAGASISLLHSEMEGQLGTDMLGVYGKIGADIGKAEAKVDASLGLFDDKGFNPSAHVGASAEAIAAGVNAEVGGKVLGTDVGVEASAYVGIGAHADFGVKDWKLTADIGAAVGVGASVKLEVDLSGTVEAVAGAAESVGNFISDGAEAVGGFFEDVGNGIGDFFGW